MPEPITGDATQGAQVLPVVCEQPFPIVLAAALADKDHPINDERVSGKKLGAACIENTAGVLVAVMASGAGDTDKWVNFAGVDVVTPS